MRATGGLASCRAETFLHLDRVFYRVYSPYMQQITSDGTYRENLALEVQMFRLTSAGLIVAAVLCVVTGADAGTINATLSSPQDLTHLTVGELVTIDVNLQGVTFGSDFIYDLDTKVIFPTSLLSGGAGSHEFLGAYNVVRAEFGVRILLCDPAACLLCDIIIEQRRRGRDLQ